MKFLHRLSSWFYQKTSLKLVLLFLGLEILAVAVVLPKFEASLATHTPLKIFDLRFGFSPDEAYELLDGLGEAGRAQYRLLEVTLDLVYPWVYAGFFVWLISLLYRQVFAAGAALRLINLLPLLVLVMDYLENAGIVQLINRFPERAEGLVWWVSVFNQIKWVAFFVVVGMTVVGLGKALLARRKRG